MSATIIKPDLNKEHSYAIGVKVEGGGFCPIQSFPSIEDLESGYRRMYKGAVAGELTRPVAVEKTNPEEGWDNARCVTVPELMKKIVNEEEPQNL